VNAVEPGAPGEPVRADGPGRPDDGWRRLHPATPLLRGGVVLVAIAVWAAVQLRDVWVTILLGDVLGEVGRVPEDPAARWVFSNVGLALLIVLVVIIGILVIGWLSWRLHSYRVTADVVEEREGIIWRKHRRARLDRIQGVNVERPLLARIFGAARVEVSVAGENANIRLYALGSATANALREELLAAASSARAARATEGGMDPGDSVDAGRPGVISQRLQELTSPELDSRLSTPDSLVRMDLGRLLGSTALSLALPILMGAAVIVVPVLLTGQWGVVFLVVPGVIGFGAYAIRRVTRSLRYTIAGTEHGIRVGFGLLSTTNETLPAGRIHAIEVTQPLLWRPFGWWSVRINRASRSTRDGAAGQAATTILPVGDSDDVVRVIELIVPGLDLRGALGGAGAVGLDPRAPEYVTSPPRARVFRWWSWRRNGYHLTDEAVLLRKGSVWRTLTIVPFARVQSVALSSGPIARATRLRRVSVHTVMGPIVPSLGAIDVADAERLAREAESRTLVAMASQR